MSLDISESQQSSGSPRTSRRAGQTFHSNTVDEQEDEILGHISLRMALFVSKFLKGLTNKGKVVVTGKRSRVNLGAGYGLEIPCTSIFSGDKNMSIPWLKSKLESLSYEVL